jgi:uncharacterized protein DUF4953/uncharacterized protein DUF5117/uncharacterized protein DUF5118
MKARITLATLLVASVLVLWSQAQNPPAGNNPSNAFPGNLGTAPASPATPPVQQALQAKDFEDFDKLTTDSEKSDGLFKLYRKKERLYMEIEPQQFDKPYLFLISIARGIGSGLLLGGMTWQTDDDWLISFRRVGDRVHVVRRNVRFSAQPGTPTAEAVQLSYSDSVLASLRIASVRAVKNSVLIDFTDFLSTDVGDLASALRLSLGGFYRIDPFRSSLGKAKSYPINTEIQMNAAYVSDVARPLDTVPDSRSLTITVHYSITQLPETGYKPRLADDRVGYFVTARKDYSKPVEETAFVRLINRWHLEKRDPQAASSPVKKPIIFWLEKTVPYQYRKYVKEGILEWNKAFEKLGFEDAIQVRNQEDDPEFDPEDARYSTFRWITASAGFAMGPSRVNPLTGQIFDADIIFDADFIRIWQQEWDTFHDRPPKPPTGTAGWDTRPTHMARCGCCDLLQGRTLDLAFGYSVLALRDAAPGGKIPDELIGQGIKETVMHEVGHTLGLRHNFKGSTMWDLKDLHDTSKTRAKGLVASVMDYNPVNVAPKGVKQGDFYSNTLGPYDYFAIEYGYKPITAATFDAEQTELKKIASRSAQPDLAYSTDEDTREDFHGRSMDPDPFSNRWDLGKDPMAFARQQADIIEELWQGKLLERAAQDGKGYQRVQQTFTVLLLEYGKSLDFAARYVGGQEFHRNYKGDPDAKLPFNVASTAKQREALEFLKQRAFSDTAFNFSPELLNSLAPERWTHWGIKEPRRLDYPIHERVLRTQALTLGRLYGPLTLARVLDNERKCKPGENCVTLPEVFRETTQAIWSELELKADAKQPTDREPLISSFRRGLQREHLKTLIDTALHPLGGTPEDARTLAWFTLKRLDKQIDEALKKSDKKLDDYTRAHLEESQTRIRKALEASFQNG